MACVLLFGGSFNPIHHGHLIIARAAAEQLDATRCILIPTGNPPHKSSSDLASALHRLEMCRRAVRDEPLFEVSDWEANRAERSFTLHTVEHFHAELSANDPDLRLCWLIGQDSLAELHTWHRIGDLAERCTLVTAKRPSTPAPSIDHLRDLVATDALERIRANILDTPEIDISATHIRMRLKARQSTRYLLPDAVHDYLDVHPVY